MSENIAFSSFNKTEIFSTILKLAVFSISTFVTMKFMLKHLDPSNKRKAEAAKRAKDILTKLGIKETCEFSEYELMIASHLMDPSDIKITWGNIGGLKNVIQEIKETVILPIRRKDLFADSELTQPPKGVLMHGPPGCGKTMIAKATAKEARTRFINLDVSILTDKWYGESQKLAAAVFSLAIKLQPCIIFIDEIDSFLRSRNMRDHEATAMMKAQFMTLWDGLSTDPNCTVIVMGATNRPHDLDKAILRRMPAAFHISLPDKNQRKDILQLTLENELIDSDINLDSLADEAEGFSGSDLFELCRNASMYRIKDINFEINFEKNGNADKCGDTESLRPITMEDLSDSLRRMKNTKVNTSGLNLD